MPDWLTQIDAIAARPDDGPRWLALSSWLWDNDRDDESDAVRVFWPVLRDNVQAGVAVTEALYQLERQAAALGLYAQHL